MRLRHLAADRPAADDDEVFGPLGQVEDRLVGEIGDRVEAGDRRHARRGAGGDDEILRLHRRPVRLDLVLAGEARGGLQHGDAEPFEALDRIIRGDGADDAVHVIVDTPEFHLGLVRDDAEAVAVADRVRRVARGNQGFRGDTAVVEAVAAHLALLDEHRARAHLRRAGRDGQAA